MPIYSNLPEGFYPRPSDVDAPLRSPIGRGPRGPKGHSITAEVIDTDPYGYFRVQFKDAETGEVLVTTPNLDVGSRIYACDKVFDTAIGNACTAHVLDFSTMQMRNDRGAIRVGDLVIFRNSTSDTTFLTLDTFGIGIVTSVVNSVVTFVVHSVITARLRGGGTPGGGGSTDGVLYFDTVDSMVQSDSLYSGLFCRTGGFHQVNDGGGAWYRITGSGTANGMDVIACGSLFANLLFEDTLTPEMLGARGDGTTDDTATIARAVTLGNVVCTKSSYKISISSHGASAITIPSNRTIDFNHATLTMGYSGLSSYFILMIGNTENVTIMNGTIVGDLAQGDDRDGEWGRGIGVFGNNVLIENMRVLSCQGDGIYIGTENGINTLPPDHVTIRNCVCNGNGRNGIGLISGTNCLIEDSEFSYNDHKAPKFGIDIEPNDDKPVKVMLNNCVFKGNGGSPLGVYNKFSTDCDVIANNIYTEQTAALGITISEGLGSHVMFDNVICNCSSGYALSLDCYEDSSIDIGSVTVNFGYENASLLYSQNLRNATIGNLKINGTSLQVFSSNGANIYLNIDVLDPNILISPRNISNTHIVVNESTKTTLINDSSSVARDQFASTIVFDSTLNVLTTYYCEGKEMPDKFTITLFNNSAVRNRMVTEAQNVIQDDDSLANTCYVEPGSMRILQYSKLIGKFLIVR